MQVFSEPQPRLADRLRIFIYELPHELTQVLSRRATHSHVLQSVEHRFSQ